MSQSDDAYIDGRPIADLKVVELRHELEIRNLPKSGKKNELAERLRNYLISNDEDDGEQKAGQDNSHNYKEYRSLTEVRPVSKSPTKSPLKSPTSNVSSGAESPVKQTESGRSTEETPDLIEEDTFHTAHNETADFDESPKKEQKQKGHTYDETPKKEKLETTNMDGVKEQSTTESAKESMPDEKSEEDEKSHSTDDAYGTASAPVEEKSPHDEDVINVHVQDDEEDMVETDLHVKGEEELDYEEDVKHNDKNGSEPQETTDEKKPKTDTTDGDSTDSKVVDDISARKLIKGEQKQNNSDDSTTPEGFVRRRAVSPARNKPSEFLHIRNLKRPFTVKTLKELLENFGEISDDDFWIDSIKTNCIVKYASVEQAEVARSRLHHVVWPPSSDTSLLIEFANEEKLVRRRGDNVPAATEPATNITIVVENKRDSSMKSEKRDPNKLYVDSQKRKLDDTPKKSLDDLFKKTIAKPPVYYLPLSESKAERRWADRLKSGPSNGHGDGGERRRRYEGGRRDGSPSRKRDRRDSPIRRRH